MLQISSLFQLGHIIVFEANHLPREISRAFSFSTREINPQKLVNYTSECMRYIHIILIGLSSIQTLHVATPCRNGVHLEATVQAQLGYK